MGLINANDELVVEASPNILGGGFLALYNDIGQGIIKMESDPNGYGNLTVGSDFETKAAMEVTSLNEGIVSVYNSLGNRASVLTEIDDYGFIGISRPNGLNIAAMSRTPLGDEGFIYTTNSEGTRVSQMTTDGFRNGYIGVQNSNGAPIISLQGTETGMGLFELLDDELEVLVKVTGDGNKSGKIEISNSLQSVVTQLGATTDLDGSIETFTEDGKKLTSITPSVDGGGGVKIYDFGENKVGAIETNQYGGMVKITDANGDNAAVMKINDLVEAEVSVYNSSGSPASRLTQQDDYGYIEVKDPLAYTLATMQSSQLGEGMFTVQDREGTILSQMTAALGSGFVGVHNSTQVPIAGMYGTENGDGLIDVLNNQGFLLVSLAKDLDQEGGKVTVYNESNVAEIASLGTNFQNKGQLEINNDVGVQQAVVSSLTNGGYVAVNNSSGEDVARMDVNTSGAGVVIVDNASGDRAVQLNSLTSGHGYIGIENGNNDEMIRLTGSSNGAGAITVRNASENDVAFMGSLTSGHGFLGNKNTSNNYISYLSSTSGGDGFFAVTNSSGNTRARLTTNNNGGGFLGINNGSGQERAQGTTLSNGAGAFFTYGNNGVINCSVSTSFSNYPNNGCVRVYDSHGSDRAGICINESGFGQSWADIKHFKIDHPKDASKEIWYASLEGAEAGAYVRGTARLSNGEVTIPLPDHFSEVAISDGMTVQLTPMSAESEGLAVIKKTTSEITVKELRKGQGNYEFDYIIHAVRKGYESYEVIRPKREEIEIMLDEGKPEKAFLPDFGMDRTPSSLNESKIELVQSTNEKK